MWVLRMSTLRRDVYKRQVMYRAIARCAKVEVFPEPMYDYRIHTGSTMKSGIAEKNLVILDCLLYTSRTCCPISRRWRAWV